LFLKRFDLGKIIILYYYITMDSVFSESLAYQQLKKRSVSARSFRTKIASTNGVVFSPEQTIQVDLPGNLTGQFYDFSSMYLKFKVSNATAAYTLDRPGALGFVKRLQISQNGAQICDINNYNVLCTAMMDTDASSEWKAGYGNILLGTHGDALSGITVPADSVRTYCMPIVLNPLFNSTPHRLIPAFSLSSIQLRLQLDSVASAVRSTGAPVLVFSEVEVVCMMTELAPQAMAMLSSATGGKYTILANSFMNSQATLASGASQLTQNLGFSMSSVERIVLCHRPTATIASQAAFSLGNRTTSGITQFQYLINSESYPARPVIVADAGAESTAEFLIADHSLVDWNKGCGLSNGVVQRVAGAAGSMVGSLSGSAPEVAKSACFRLLDGAGTIAGDSTSAGAATANSNIGTFILSTDFENGLSVGKSATIYSGISTIASNVQFLGTYDVSGTGHAAAQLDFFAQYSVLLSLDMMGSGVFSISV
jgi:hypothetical protein